MPLISCIRYYNLSVCTAKAQYMCVEARKVSHIPNVFQRLPHHIKHSS